jgi:hypothetical protein
VHIIHFPWHYFAVMMLAACRSVQSAHDDSNKRHKRISSGLVAHDV